MAHRIERRAVRGDRHAARRRVAPLPLAALVVALAAGWSGAAEGGAGAASLLGSVLSDAPEWWRETGRPGGWPGATGGDGYPWVFAGLARGAWDVVEPLMGARDEAFPGTASAREPLAWFDSLEVSAGEGAAWRGYDASLAAAAPGAARASLPGTRAMFHFLDGDYGLDETGLRIERGDSLRALRVGALSSTRGPRGALELAGRHLWGASGVMGLGEHSFEAGYAQRAVASSLKGGEQQALKGESGRLVYRFRRGAIHSKLSAARGRGVGESFLPGRDVDVWSRREAQRNEIALEAGAAGESRDLGLRLAWSESRVRRSGDPAFDRSANALWVAARLTQAAGDGTLDLGVGAGHHDAFGGWDWAPSAAYHFAGGPFQGRVVMERMLAPVWTDLGPGVQPFLQRTWVAGCEIGAASAGGRRANLGILFGTSRDRAIVSRLPLEEQWLRKGLAPDPGRYDFGLLTAGAAWRGPAFGLSAEGFALAHDPSAIQPQVDPPYGGRAAVELALTLFEKELGIVLRGEVEGVGPRESEAPVPRRIDGFASFGLAGTFTLGDAVVTMRIRNFENRPRPETWIDSATGREAVGVGQEFRIGFAWRLFN